MSNIRNWSALREACRKQHPTGPGGAAMCACGAACGSSPACAMLATLKQFFACVEPGDVPESLRPLLSSIKDAIH